jgi:NADPH:quinone reductase
MKAVLVEKGELVLREDVPRPVPGATQLLVRVRTAGVNNADLMRNAYHFGRHDGPPVPGLEFAGEVVQAGAEVQGFEVGDRVMALAGSAYAEYAVVDHRLAVRVPDALDWTQAGGVMVVYQTAHDALGSHGRLRAGDAVLVTACTSGVGIAASQIASYLRAGCVVGTSTTPAKLEQARAFGVTVPVDAKANVLAARTQEATGGRGADVIVDSVGGAECAAIMEAAAIAARWITVGRIGGKNATLDLGELARKRLELIGVTFRTRSLFERMEVARAFAHGVLPALACGAIQPKIDRVFPLAEAAAAQEHMRAGRHYGKIVLEVAP